MKQETYIKISEIVRKYPSGEKIVRYANIIITRIVYMAYFAMLLILAVCKDMRIIKVVLVPAISFVIVSIFRHISDTPRPYVIYEFSPIIKKEKMGQSMPSRHVFSAFVIGMSAFYLYPVFGILIFIDGIIMCIGRVVAGVHFPKDVIVGALIGIISGIIGFYII